MKTKLWKSAGRLPHGLELQYRVDDGELCWEYEEQLVAIAANTPHLCTRECVSKVFTVTLARRDIEFVVVPRGSITILECDLEPHIIEGFLNGPADHRQDRLH